MIASRAWLKINFSVAGFMRLVLSRNLIILGPVLFFIVLGQATASEHDMSEHGTSEISKLQTLAEQGDTTAQVHLGMRYQQVVLCLVLLLSEISLGE